MRDDTIGDSPDTPRVPTRPVGRPRRLELAQILDAAIVCGLERFTMGEVAERLGVRVSVLYGYVNGRDELVQLAARQATRQSSFPTDYGQSWRTYASEYAHANYALLASDAQLMPLLVDGRLDPALKIDSAEQWIAAMTARGFSGEDAIHLLSSIDLITIGGALVATYNRAFARGGKDHGEQLRAIVGAYGAKRVPQLSRHLEAFAASAETVHWEGVLTVLLDSTTPTLDEVSKGS